MTESESGGVTVPQRDDESPPELSFTIPKPNDVNQTSKRWQDVDLPIDILLLTVNGYGFLCCYHYLSEVFKSYHAALGFVYFGEMGEVDGEKLKIALMQCREGGGEPGGAGIAVPKAVELLQPKAVFCIGACAALHCDKTKLGDVVAPAKLTTYAQRQVTATKVVPCGFTVPASRNISQIIPCAAFGWKPPLENPKPEQEVKVHCDGEMLSGPETIGSNSRRNELVLLYPNAIAVEMDGDGLFAAAHDLRTEWVVIKGISRYADCITASEDWAAFANAMAASVVNNILSEPYVFEQWPHYQSTTNKTNERSQEQTLLPMTNWNVGSLLGSLVQAFVGNCVTGKLNYKGRTIHYSARRRIHSFGELCVYDATARDPQSGISEEAHHYDTSQEAIEHALQKVKNKLRDRGFIQAC